MAAAPGAASEAEAVAFGRSPERWGRGELALVRAVFADAVLTLLRGLGSAVDLPEKMQEAREWFLDEGRSDPFSFLGACELLGLDPGRTRKEVLANALPQLPIRQPSQGKHGPRRRVWTERELEDMRRLVARGVKLREVAERYNTSIGTVSKLTGGCASFRVRQRHERVIALKKAGLSYRRIAAELGLHKITVLRIVKGRKYKSGRLRWHDDAA